ncbi:MAG: cob(I)yrinic acid a,c-diamide adenosyltransferase [Bacteroidales bacterium]|nr:cob(I)yrinic acid a,c-diamide adenosyltransferase [Bacteroidales bacterium]
MKQSNIYTRGGDKGQTSLLGGRRVPKNHIKIETYGTVDELMANTALLRDLVDEDDLRKQLLEILDKLMSSASILAADGDNLPENMPVVTENDVTYLEKIIDVMDDSLPALTSFIIPGGGVAASQAHIARTICRRAERIILRLAEEEDVEEILIKYFNRLSDYYFLLARKLAHASGSGELRWKP